ncbi:MAG: hypothetical protein R6X25_11290 [Candidatus Krumholzibacteriia bacterium]
MAGDRQPDRYALARRVIELLEPELAEEGYQLLDVRVYLGGGRHQVRIYLDEPAEPGGIDLAGCARASRTADTLLEEADLFPGQYVVEVSSPGVRRPLRTAGHFAAAVGEDVELKLRRGSVRPRLRGRLEAVTEDGALVVSERARRTESEAGGEPDGETAVPSDDAPAPGVEAPVPGAESAAPGAEAASVRVPLADVLEANLDPEFDVQALIGEDRRRRKEEKRRRREERGGSKRGRRRSPGSRDDEPAS